MIHRFGNPSPHSWQAVHRNRKWVKIRSPHLQRNDYPTSPNELGLEVATRIKIPGATRRPTKYHQLWNIVYGFSSPNSITHLRFLDASAPGRMAFLVKHIHIEWADALVPPTPFQGRPLRRCKMRTENWEPKNVNWMMFSPRFLCFQLPVLYF